MTESNNTPPPTTHVMGGELKRLATEIAALKLHPTTSEEYDAGYIAARNDAFAIVQEAIDNLPKSVGLSEATARRVLKLLDVYVPNVFSLEMAATVASSALSHSEDDADGE